MSFWENVDSELEYKGMTRKALAQEAGFSLVNIGKGIKLGSCPSADTALKIAKILGVSVEYLVNGISDNESENENENKQNFEIAKFKKYRKIVDSLSVLSPKAQKAVFDLIENLKGM